MHIPKNIERLENIISKSSGVDVADMRSRSRIAEYSNARFAVWYIAHDMFGYSYNFLAIIYGRDHTTIVSGVNKIRKSQYFIKIREIVASKMSDLVIGNNKQKISSIQTWR